jgi:putative hydrolase of the HAD superfamily
VFSGVNSQEIPEAEYKWWKSIVANTFQEVGVFEQISDFPALFTRIYAHFATADPWQIYPDTMKSLQVWHQQGIELGIISNFDTRLYAVLELLGIRQYFQTITISSNAGSAKPDSRIFLVALEKHNCPPDQAWHIGDSPKEDYEGAKAVGIKPILIERKHPLF